MLDLGNDSEVFGLDTHPSEDLVALGLVDGRALLYAYQGKGEGSTLRHEAGRHAEACRAVLFDPTTGSRVFTASSDKSIRAVDVATGKTTWTIPTAHEEAVNCLHYWGDGGEVLCSGDDVGGVRLWDCRQAPNKPWATANKHEDFISDLLAHDGLLFGASGDNTMSTYDLRQRKLLARTMDQEDELLSLCVLKHGRKVVAGTQSGVLLIYSWGEWMNCSDRFVGHPETVEALVKVDEETLLTGSSDGLIRLCTVLPNKLIGVMGSHDDFPVERMKLSGNRGVLVSIAHDSCVRFWDMSILEEGEEEESGGEEEESEEEMVGKTKKGGGEEKGQGKSKAGKKVGGKAAVAKKRGCGGSSSSEEEESEEEDEEEEDEEEEEEVDEEDDGESSSSSEEEEEEEEPKGRRGRTAVTKKLKMTPSESFFQDL